MPVALHQVSLMNGALDLNATEIDSLESQLEENGRVISSYEHNIEEKQQLLEQVCLSAVCV